MPDGESDAAGLGDEDEFSVLDDDEDEEDDDDELLLLIILQVVFDCSFVCCFLDGITMLRLLLLFSPSPSLSMSNFSFKS
jgi:hypothetical protein